MLTSNEYLDLLKEQVIAGKEASMIITGNSMSPFLEHGRDTIYFKTPDRPLKRGDMIFFQRENGQYVMHRLVKIKNDACYCIGDNQTETEGPIPKERVFALITRVKRKNKLIDKKNGWWFFFSHVWIHLIPLRHFLIGCYKIFFASRLR